MKFPKERNCALLLQHLILHSDHKDFINLFILKRKSEFKTILKENIIHSTLPYLFVYTHQARILVFFIVKSFFFRKVCITFTTSLLLAKSTQGLLALHWESLSSLCLTHLIHLGCFIV